MEKVHHHSKKVFRYTVTGKFVKEYESIREAAEALGTSPETISLVLRKINKTAKGYQFSYEKVERMDPVDYVRNQMVNVSLLNKKRSENIQFLDLGIIEDVNHREFGKRKIRIAGKMDIYARPDRPVQEVVNVYSKAI